MKIHLLHSISKCDFHINHGNHGAYSYFIYPTLSYYKLSSHHKAFSCNFTLFKRGKKHNYHILNYKKNLLSYLNITFELTGIYWRHVVRTGWMASVFTCCVCYSGSLASAIFCLSCSSCSRSLSLFFMSCIALPASLAAPLYCAIAALLQDIQKNWKCDITTEFSQ